MELTAPSEKGEVCMTFTYEIYVFERSRWVLESSFAADRRRDALDLARRIEAHQSANGVQVIRERVDRDTGHVERTTVYNTWRKRKAKAWRAARGEEPGPYAEILAVEPVEDDLLPEPIYPSATPIAGAPASVDRVITKLVAIVLASLGLATLITAVHSGASAGAFGL